MDIKNVKNKNVNSVCTNQKLNMYTAGLVLKNVKYK